MQVHDSNPGLARYRAARAKGGALAIAKAEISAANPSLTESQVKAIAEAHVRLKQRRS